MADTSYTVFSPEDSELLQDQDAAQSILRSHLAQRLVYGKQPKKIWKLIKSKWITHGFADNFNYSPFLGRTVGSLPSLFCGHRNELWPKQQQSNWPVSFESWLIINFHMHLSIFLLPSADGCRWGWGLREWRRHRMGGVWVPEWPSEGVQSPQSEYPPGAVMWEP